MTPECSTAKQDKKRLRTNNISDKHIDWLHFFIGRIIGSENKSKLFRTIGSGELFSEPFLATTRAWHFLWEIIIFRFKGLKCDMNLKKLILQHDSFL